MRGRPSYIGPRRVMASGRAGDPRVSRVGS